ncbi:MAG: DUF4390 domain-containing protein [Comamonadaceae bacterium CG_4_9_14_0_8_um_filter_60_18]|nr:MAG: hypothetical protein AUK52_04725 [Comamonadaceae bacterium CG2_30_60_41]PIW08028.1 MAG: DUF4390 domain-containing protein [Comamonadaceae bacterium CG17_big_fil_post_rev_8_21_14_2_50_60_13]PIY26757.1 MAG: DUF4390 domain-containing protein [Comamonadaceae bacterium CG_4_10_14_3_um_filter_60_75]PJC12431.1 MAG: DUF4390 domain-containing protein [Comamonadaceae bacterium CG_4_9_14_0_8_um_filter_60_18]
MMAFITHCLKRSAPRLGVSLLSLVLLCGFVVAVHAAEDADAAITTSGTTPVLTIERAENALWLSANFAFGLPAVVEDALLKGIPIYFVTQVDVLRERWYWTNRTVASVQRRARLAYHPLTRRWRLSLGAPDAPDSSQGLTLSQNYDSLETAMAAVRRISHWRIADLSSIEQGASHLLEFRFQLDTTELPRPLQIGTLGQSDWVISLSVEQKLAPELIR